jgi:hypothetical protein
MNHVKLPIRDINGEYFTTSLLHQFFKSSLNSQYIITSIIHHD